VRQNTTSGRHGERRLRSVAAAKAPVREPDVVSIPGGRFRMGTEGGRSDEAPSHDVELAPFFLGRTPVTRSEYEPFLAGTETPPPPWWFDPDFGKPDQPVVGVTWDEAVAFTEWLSRECGGRWRLPTGAEWEMAARGGLSAAATAWGASVPAGEVPTGQLDAPWPVGRGFANPYGLYDITTIVHEWCLDWYAADYYSVSPSRDPRGPEEGQRRSSRGGSWRHHVRWSPPTARSSLPPTYQYADYGLRVLREIG